MKIVQALQRMRVGARMQYVYEHLSELERLTCAELTKVGTLLCHASSPEMRAEYPIIGERQTTLQEAFETKVFGDEDRGIDASYISLSPEEDEDGHTD